MPVEMWTHAVRHAIYLHNIMPTRSLKRRCATATPFEALTGAPPDYTKLQRFGAKAFVSAEQTKTFDPRARVGIYVGYSEQNDSHLVYFPDTQSVVSTMHVTFDNDLLLREQQPLTTATYDDPMQAFAPLTGLQEAIKRKAEQDEAAKRFTAAMQQRPAPPTAASSGSASQTVNMAPRMQQTWSRPLVIPSATKPVEQPAQRVVTPAAPAPQVPTAQLPQVTAVKTAPPPMTAAEPQSAVVEVQQSATAAESPQATDSEQHTEQTASQQTATVTVTAPARGEPTRPKREIKRPKRYADDDVAVSALLPDPPRTHAAAMKSDQAEMWSAAYDKQLQTLKAADTYETVTLDDVPDGAKILVPVVNFKYKTGSDGSIIEFKARINAGGHQQRLGMDFDDVYAPVMTYTSVRVLLAVAAKMNMHVHQLDAVAAFLNGKLDKPAFMWPPPGEPTHNANGQRLVCKLTKALYGLHEAPRIWNEEISRFMKAEGLYRSQVDPGVFVSESGDIEMMLLTGLWVDDLIIASKSLATIQRFKRAISKVYKMVDKGEIKWCLGMEVERTSDGIKLSQAAYITKLLERFGMSDAYPVATPFASGVQLSSQQSPVDDSERQEMANVPYREAVGALIHLVVCTRPDVAYQVSQLARYSANPGRTHWTALKHLLRYLKGTKTLGVQYHRVNPSGDSMSELKLEAYVDASFAGDCDDRKSTTGFVTMLAGGPVSWSSKRQTLTAQSTAEAEYVAAAAATSEVIHLRQLLAEIGLPQGEPTVIHEDNNPCIHMANNPSTSARTKHIDLKYHIVRERVSNGDVKLVYVPTQDQVADVLTKSVSGPTLQRLRPWLMGAVPRSTI